MRQAFQILPRAAVVGCLAIGMLCPAAYALEIKGLATQNFEGGLFSDGASSEMRQQAVQAAKLNAWKHYTETFNASRMQNYQRLERDFLSHLDDYVTDAVIVDETLNKDAKIYTVVVRTNINEAAVDSRFNASMAAGAKSGEQSSPFTFVFVARETASVKSFDTRRTTINDTQSEKTASRQTSLRGDGASLEETGGQTSKVTTGGSGLVQANETKYRVRSVGDIDAATSDLLGSSGFEPTSYPDVYGNCGGPKPEAINADFTDKDEMSADMRKQVIDTARTCGIVYLAVGTLDIGLSDVDPVSGNQRVYVSVRGQVWDISPCLPRKLASVGPVQYGGLGPTTDVAMRNALIMAAQRGTRALIDQLGAKGVR